MFYECNGAGDCGTPAHYVPGQQWGLNKVGAPQAWKYTTGSSKVKVRGRQAEVRDVRVRTALCKVLSVSALGLETFHQLYDVLPVSMPKA